MEADGTSYLDAALQTEPESMEDYCNRGLVYYYMEDYVSAQTELIEAINKGSKEAVLLMGSVYQAQGDYDNARTMYNQYISENTDNARGYSGLAACDLSQGDYDGALEKIEQGIQTADADELQDLLFNEIVVYEKKLDFATALTKTREYLDMYPDDTDAQKEEAFLKSRVS